MTITTQLGAMILVAFLAGAAGAILLYRWIDQANRRNADTERRLAESERRLVDLEERDRKDQEILDAAKKRERPHWNYSERESLEGIALRLVRDLEELKAEYKAKKGRLETTLAILGVVLNGKKD